MAELTYDWVAGKPKTVPMDQLPPKVYEKDGLRIIDLTKVIDPSTESRRCNLWRFNTGGDVPDFHTNVDIGSHLGTHCECPYHHDNDWPSVAELPLGQFMGRGIYQMLDLPEDHQITGADLEAAIGDRIQPGDTVILDSPHQIPPFTSLTGGPTDHRLQVGADCAQWLADHKVQCVGFGDGRNGIPLVAGRHFDRRDLIGIRGQGVRQGVSHHPRVSALTAVQHDASHMPIPFQPGSQLSTLETPHRTARRPRSIMPEALPPTALLGAPSRCVRNSTPTAAYLPGAKKHDTTDMRGPDEAPACQL